MKRWLAAYGVLVACIALILANRSSDPALLQDSDTRALIAGIEARGAPLSWFAGDWPLANHFYRPLPTLTFEFDLAVHGADAAGFGLTNALLAAGCTAGVFWLMLELWRLPWAAATAAGVFTLWLFDLGGWLAASMAYLSPIAVLIGFMLRQRIGWPLVAGAMLWYLSLEATGIASLHHGILDWLPGRTASVMTFFALVSLAAYARFQRGRPMRVPPKEPGPLDPPATKSTSTEATGGEWQWAVLSMVALLLALASYEQAVMIPAVLLVVGWVYHMRGRRVAWGLHAAFWGLLVAFLALRWNLVPSDPSRYQLQQFREGPGVRLSLFDYFAPGLRAWEPLSVTIGLGLAALWIPSFYAGMTKLLGWVVGMAAALRGRRWAGILATWAMSGLAFLPMAWLKHFDHYHLWPMSLRAVFFVVLMRATGDALVNATSRPELRAPARLDPAPGSLPRP